MKRWITAKLVRWSVRWWDASYNAYCRFESDNVSKGYLWFWTKGAIIVQNRAIPLAIKLDEDTAGEEMAKGGWWG